MTFTIQGVQLQMGETTTYRHMGYKAAEPPCYLPLLSNSTPAGP